MQTYTHELNPVLRKRPVLKPYIDGRDRQDKMRLVDLSRFSKEKNRQTRNHSGIDGFQYTELLNEFWCPEEDSNLHTLRHTDLNRARLPIPPSGLQDGAL